MGEAGNIGRGHRRGKAQGELPVVVAHGKNHVHRDENLFPGRNVGHTRGEQMGPLLLQQGAAFSSPPGGVIDLPRLGPFPNLAENDPLTDAQFHACHRRVMGKGEQIFRLYPIRPGVVKTLRQRGLGKEPRHLQLQAAL